VTQLCTSSTSLRPLLKWFTTPLEGRDPRLKTAG